MNPCILEWFCRQPQTAGFPKAKSARQLPQQPVLRAFHLAALAGSLIVIASQMEHGMHDIPDKLALPRDAKSPSLAHSFFQANKNFTAQRLRPGGIGIVERDHVGNAPMSKEGLVQGNHFRAGNEVKAQLKSVYSQQLQ
jgi:hypothetical protein